MRLVIQRVIRADLWANGAVCGQINTGLVAFAGFAKGDRTSDADYLSAKLVQLRVFENAEGKMNRSCAEAAGELMLVPNFTLYANTTKGNRPGFDQAAKPEDARPLYEYFVRKVGECGLRVISGIFQSDMRVLVDNDGPVTLVCDSPPR